MKLRYTDIENQIHAMQTYGHNFTEREKKSFPREYAYMADVASSAQTEMDNLLTERTNKLAEIAEIRDLTLGGMQAVPTLAATPPGILALCLAYVDPENRG